MDKLLWDLDAREHLGSHDLFATKQGIHMPSNPIGILKDAMNQAAC